MTPPATADKPKQRRDPQVFGLSCEACGTRGEVSARGRNNATKLVGLTRYVYCPKCPGAWKQIPGCDEAINFHLR